MKTIFTLLLSFISLVAVSQVRIYPLDGNATEIVSGMNGIMGTGIHEPTVTSDRFNNPNSALYFDGNDFIQIPTTGILNDTFSVSAWVTVSSLPSNPSDQDFYSIGDATGDQRLGIDDDAFGQGFFFAGWTMGNEFQLFHQGVLPLINSWHHAVGVYSSLKAKFYVDGQIWDSVTAGIGNPEYGSSPTAFIGCRETSISFWQGKIDELRIYDRALTSAEIVEIFSGIQEPEQQTSVIIIPNPLHEQVVINGTNLNGTIFIFNSIGEKLKESKIKNEILHFLMLDYAPGIYYLNYFDDTKSLTEKFIKE